MSRGFFEGKQELQTIKMWSIPSSDLQLVATFWAGIFPIVGVSWRRITGDGYQVVRYVVYVETFGRVSKRCHSNSYVAANISIAVYINAPFGTSINQQSCTSHASSYASHPTVLSFQLGHCRPPSLTQRRQAGLCSPGCGFTRR